MKRNNVGAGFHARHIGQSIDAKGNPKDSGITLIALIITIIIMLILAGVTISIVVNGGLFKQAQKAVDLTKEAAQNEQDMINDVVDQMNNDANGGDDSVDGALLTGNVSYSPTEPTNQPVTATITIPPSASLPDDWTKVDGDDPDTQQYTKTYTTNTEEDVTITYADETPETAVHISIANIDTKIPNGNPSYSTQDPTNQPVTVTINTDKPLVSEPAGWTKGDDAYTYTRVYTINTEEDVTIVDKVGNEGTVHISITNIDTTNLNGMASYEPSTWTTGNVTVTITTNKAIGTPYGWTIVDGSNGTQFTKVYTGNTTEDVAIADTASNGTVNVAVTNIDKTAPTITLSQNTVVTSPKTVTAVISDDISGVSVRKWAYGSQTASYFASSGTTFTGTTFICENNIVCTVYAKDNAGNAAVKTITVSGITDWTFSIAAGYKGFPGSDGATTSTTFAHAHGVYIPKVTPNMGTLPAGTWTVQVTGTKLSSLQIVICSSYGAVQGSGDVTASSSTSASVKITTTSTTNLWSLRVVNTGTASCTITKVRIYK